MTSCCHIRLVVATFYYGYNFNAAREPTQPPQPPHRAITPDAGQVNHIWVAVAAAARVVVGVDILLEYNHMCANIQEKCAATRKPEKLKHRLNTKMKTEQRFKSLKQEK